MTSPSPSDTATRGATLRVRLPGLALALAWAALAVAAQGTTLGTPTLCVALASVAWLAWMMCAQTRSATGASGAADVSADCTDFTPLLDATLAKDLDTVLAEGAALLGAERLWLRVEAPLRERCLGWPAAAGLEAPTWFEETRLTAGPWSSDAGQALRCALPLQQRDVRVGVLAFEGASPAGPRAPRLLRAASAVATLITHLLLVQHLEARLAQLDEQQARERRVFLANLSHKLRTPMTAILGFAQILSLDETLQDEQREFVREIEVAGQTLLDMLNELVGIPS